MISRAFLAIIFGLLIAYNAWAEQSFRYLHISTNPSYAEAYINSVHKDFHTNPDYKLPGFIEVPAEEHSVLLTIFKPGFKDTTINVTLSDADTSYLIVSLTPSYDDAYLNYQQKSLAHRARRNVGHKLMIASALPLAVSGIAALVTLNEIDQAQKEKDLTEKSTIRDGDGYNKHLDRYSSYRDKANSAKTVTLTTLIVGASLLTFGVILSF